MVIKYDNSALWLCILWIDAWSKVTVKKLISGMSFWAMETHTKRMVSRKSRKNFAGERMNFSIMLNIHLHNLFPNLYQLGVKLSKKKGEETSLLWESICLFQKC